MSRPREYHQPIHMLLSWMVHWRTRGMHGLWKPGWQWKCWRKPPAVGGLRSLDCIHTTCELWGQLWLCRAIKASNTFWGAVCPVWLGDQSQSKTQRESAPSSWELLALDFSAAGTFVSFYSVFPKEHKFPPLTMSLLPMGSVRQYTPCQNPCLCELLQVEVGCCVSGECLLPCLAEHLPVLSGTTPYTALDSVKCWKTRGRHTSVDRILT